MITVVFIGFLHILQDNITLCRFFLQEDERLENAEQHSPVKSDNRENGNPVTSDDGEQCDPGCPNDADGEYVEAMLLSLLEQDEGNSSPRNGENGSQVHDHFSHLSLWPWKDIFS